MAKYSYEFKKQIVDEYLAGNGGYRFLTKKYGLKSKGQIEGWVAAYKSFGYDGLRRSRGKKQYSFDFKLNAVNVYLSSEVSYKELALTLGINYPTLIARWVNDFRIAGPDALRPKQKGRKKSLKNSKPEKSKKSIEPDQTQADTNAERLKELEDENLRLRIENAFLKELRRLRLEDEAKMRGLPGSSTASEENSN